jgi:putative addiction module component (TIGR02574 family)
MDISVDQLRALPLPKRLEILEALCEAVESECGSEGTSEEFADELDRRYAEHVADPSSSASWDEVRAAVRRQLARVASKESPSGPHLSAEEQAEFDRRIAEHRRNRGAAKPVAVFLDELDRRYPVPEAVLDEAERELEAHLADPSSSIPWETVRARLRERYG